MQYDFSFCLFCLGVIAQEEVLQSPRSLKVSEGEQTRLSCSYKTLNFYSLQWYRQYLNKEPALIMLLASEEPQSNGIITATLSKAHTLSNLSISSAQPSDSAVYQCALNLSVS
ncbi:TVA2 protein, partial [Polyodon spathula]|nr:TVA2 protein [Polyodon spathula]